MNKLLLAILLLPSTVPTSGYVQVEYPPSTQPGELQFSVTYTVWIPEGVSKLRGVIVHQHGCGTGACKGGATAAYDLHWQALAKKWDCALLGPSYHQEDGQNCGLWCDPRNGSGKTFLRALGDLAKKSEHPELETVPWCLWGHSGGGTWSSLMHVLHPQRIVAIWLRSGTSYNSWEKDKLITPETEAAVYSIPVMANPGAKEKGDKRFNGAYTGTLAMFQACRAKGAPFGFAPDPRTSHECGDSRYLAIPFFDACLAQRLPDKGSAEATLKPVDAKAAWLAAPLSDAAQPAASYGGKAEEAVWLPNEAVAKAWMDYVKTGAVQDTTPPPAATGVSARMVRDGLMEMNWSFEVDFESGLQAFIIQKDGKDLLQIPEKPVGKFGRPLVQSMSYHDTPERPGITEGSHRLPVDDTQPHEYRVVVVNSAGLRSEPSAPASRK